MNKAQIKIFNIYEWAINSEVKLILTFSFILILVERISVKLIIFFSGSINLGKPEYLDLGLTDQFFWTVLLVPAAESFIFHFILIEIFLYLFKMNRLKNYLAISFSALLFSLFHFYSIDYMIIAFFCGLILSSCYIVAKQRDMLAFIIVLIVHSFYNLISLAIYGFNTDMIYDLLNK